MGGFPFFFFRCRERKIPPVAWIRMGILRPASPPFPHTATCLSILGFVLSISLSLPFSFSLSSRLANSRPYPPSALVCTVITTVCIEVSTVQTVLYVPLSFTDYLNLGYQQQAQRQKKKKNRMNIRCCRVFMWPTSKVPIARTKLDSSLGVLRGGNDARNRETAQRSMGWRPAGSTVARLWVRRCYALVGWRVSCFL